MNPQHLKLLSDWSDLYRHRITLAFTQHGPAQRGFAADDLNELSAADQLHAAPIRAEKELLLLVGGIDQTDQRAEKAKPLGVQHTGQGQAREPPSRSLTFNWLFSQLLAFQPS